MHSVQGVQHMAESCFFPSETAEEHAEHLNELVQEGKLDGATRHEAHMNLA